MAVEMPPLAPLCGRRRQPLYGRSFILARQHLADCDADVLAVLAGVGLRRAAPPADPA